MFHCIATECINEREDIRFLKTIDDWMEFTLVKFTMKQKKEIRFNKIHSKYLLEARRLAAWDPNKT